MKFFKVFIAIIFLATISSAQNISERSLKKLNFNDVVFEYLGVSYYKINSYTDSNHFQIGIKKIKYFNLNGEKNKVLCFNKAGVLISLAEYNGGCDSCIYTFVNNNKVKRVCYKNESENSESLYFYNSNRKSIDSIVSVNEKQIFQYDSSGNLSFINRFHYEKSWVASSNTKILKLRSKNQKKWVAVVENTFGKAITHQNKIHYVSQPNSTSIIYILNSSGKEVSNRYESQYYDSLGRKILSRLVTSGYSKCEILEYKKSGDLKKVRFYEYSDTISSEKERQEYIEILGEKIDYDGKFIFKSTKLENTVKYKYF